MKGLTKKTLHFSKLKPFARNNKKITRMVGFGFIGGFFKILLEKSWFNRKENKWHFLVCLHGEKNSKIQVGVTES